MPPTPRKQRRSRWMPLALNLTRNTLCQERYEQLLAEVSEILYKQFCQQVQKINAVTEPSFQAWENIPSKKEDRS
jgi:hypothetical protein